MREHEVPTHVQAEDKVLLWFTFPQIVAVVATCALAYGAYRYFPFAPSEVRLGIAILLGIPGHRRHRGQGGRPGAAPGGRRPAEVQAGGQALRGLPGQLTISEPPPVPEAKPDPLRLLAKKAAGKVGNAVKAARRRGVRPFRPHSWFGKGGRSRDADANRPRTERIEESVQAQANRGTASWRWPEWARWRCWPWCCCPTAPWPTTRRTTPRRKPRTSPTATPGGWTKSTSSRRSRCRGAASSSRGISVTANHANVTLRAAHELHLRGRAYGGRSGRTLRMGFNTAMSAGQSKSYNLSLDGPSPSFTFSWVDALGRSGAVSLKSDQIPFPLPKAEGSCATWQ